jgi:hypothetical protein
MSVVSTSIVLVDFKKRKPCCAQCRNSYIECANPGCACHVKQRARPEDDGRVRHFQEARGTGLWLTTYDNQTHCVLTDRLPLTKRMLENERAWRALCGYKTGAILPTNFSKESHNACPTCLAEKQRLIINDDVAPVVELVSQPKPPRPWRHPYLPGGPR